MRKSMAYPVSCVKGLETKASLALKRGQGKRRARCLFFFFSCSADVLFLCSQTRTVEELFRATGMSKSGSTSWLLDRQDFSMQFG